jgi:hypothetical protein
VVFVGAGVGGFVGVGVVFVGAGAGVGEAGGVLAACAKDELAVAASDAMVATTAACANRRT